MATSAGAAARSDEHGGRHPRGVDRQNHARFVRSGAQAGDDPGDRRPDVALVVEHREGQREPVGRLPDRDPLAAERQRFPPDLGEGAAVDACERLRRAEPRARAADEQDAGQPGAIRHGSV